MKRIALFCLLAILLISCSPSVAPQPAPAPVPLPAPVSAQTPEDEDSPPAWPIDPLEEIEKQLKNPVYPTKQPAPRPTPLVPTTSEKATPGPTPATESHPEGMESIRWLTDEEKDKVIEIALNTPEVIEMGEEYGVNKTGISWVAIEWNNGGSNMYGLDYEMVSKVPDNVPETAEFYSRVEIYFGEPERVLMRVAVNPDTGRVAHVETHGLKTLP